MTDPQVTIVVVPRERFSYAERSLANIYEQTTLPFKLVYVSAGTPIPIQRHLERESQRKGFQFIHTSDYLSPNKARNLGLREVRTKYVVFIDNDALVTPGWLDALVCCAEETGAWVVGPLCLIGAIERGRIHMAGGKLHIKELEDKRILYDEPYLPDTPLADLQAPLQRRPCDYVEFHCMLARKDTFDRLGPLDERLLSVHEHIDFCLSVGKSGGLVYIEPKAVTTYIPPPPCEWWDLPYFMLRWSEAWNLATVRHFNEKWGVSALRWSGDQSTLDAEDTIIRFARGHRRFMTDLRVPTPGMDHRPESPLEQAELTVATFLSVDRDCFALTLITEEGKVIESMSPLGPQGILERLPQILREAEEQDLSIVIQPLSSGRPNDPALVRVDDLDAEAVREVKDYAFLTLETRPQHYQCWLAVDRTHWRSAASLQRLVGQRGLNGFAPLAGSRNVQREYRQTNGGYPRVRLVEAVTGLLVSTHQLEHNQVLPYLGSSSMS